MPQQLFAHRCAAAQGQLLVAGFGGAGLGGCRLHQHRSGAEGAHGFQELATMGGGVVHENLLVKFQGHFVPGALRFARAEAGREGPPLLRIILPLRRTGYHRGEQNHESRSSEKDESPRDGRFRLRWVSFQLHYFGLSFSSGFRDLLLRCGRFA